MSEHPLRRRYGLELGLGLALAALAAWWALAGGAEAPAPSAPSVPSGTGPAR